MEPACLCCWVDLESHLPRSQSLHVRSKLEASVLQHAVALKDVQGSLGNQPKGCCDLEFHWDSNWDWGPDF